MTTSVTPCSAPSWVSTPRSSAGASSGPTRNSTVPTPLKPVAAARRDAASQSSATRGRRQARGGRLLDDGPVAALQRALAEARGPHGALAVGDHLDPEVPGLGDLLLEEDARVAEEEPGLGPDRLEGPRQVGRRGDPADAKPVPACCGGLDEERVAQPGRPPQRALDVLDLSLGPRNGGDPQLLGQQLRPDRVAQAVQRLQRRPDHDEAEPPADLADAAQGGAEAPPEPHRVGR